MAENKRKRADHTEDERKSIISHLLERGNTENGEFRLARGAQIEVAKIFDCAPSTINRIWKRAKASRDNPSIQAYRATPQKKSNCGRPPLYDREELSRALAELPQNERATIRAMAKSLGIPKSTLFDIKSEDNDYIMPHTNSLKPFLTHENELTRLLYASLEVERKPNGGFRFRDGEDVVHIDEKWFFLTKEIYRYYIGKGEKPKHRTSKHKNHIVKVMFLAATARPRYDAAGNCTFDGKIGLWPFVEHVRAQRSSHRRTAGTWETKPITVNKSTYKRFVIDKVIPAIKEKWPRDNNIQRFTVRLQHDNAKSHFFEEDEDWVQCCFENWRLWRFELKEQPANSPDCNILDLGFFRALQSLQFSRGPSANIDELIANVIATWNAYEARKIYYVFLTHQSCMAEIIKSNGGNRYSIPHMGKEALDRHGRLPHQLELSLELSLQLEQLSLLP